MPVLRAKQGHEKSKIVSNLKLFLLKFSFNVEPLLKKSLFLMLAVQKGLLKAFQGMPTQNKKSFFA
jgi:hypothetical protein